MCKTEVSTKNKQQAYEVQGQELDTMVLIGPLHSGYSMIPLIPFTCLRWSSKIKPTWYQKDINVFVFQKFWFFLIQFPLTFCICL